MFKIFKEIKGVFKAPIRKYYLGKIAHGTPYFNPWNFVSTIIKFRKLEFKSPEQIIEYETRYPHSVKDNHSYRFKNFPMVHRAKEWTFNMLGDWWWLQIGWPVYIYWHALGWKDKYDSPRFEWCPAFYVFFFKWQFCIHWTSPFGNDDKYYEMILWWSKYSDKDMEKAEQTWSWTDMETKQSTWNKDYLI